MEIRISAAPTLLKLLSNCSHFVPLRPPKCACDSHREDCGGLRAALGSVLSQLLGDGQVGGSEHRLDFSWKSFILVNDSYFISIMCSLVKTSKNADRGMNLFFLK